MDKKMTITLPGGEKKIITGSPNALELRRQVKAAYDELMREQRKMVVCAKIAEKLNVSEQRVYQILRNDYETM